VRRLLAIASIAALSGSLAACTSGSPGPDGTINVTNTRTITRSSPQPGNEKAITFKAAATLPPGQTPPKGEVEKACPYIASTPAENPDVNVADFEGDHVYRTTVLTTMKPVGCRFYFYAGPFEPIADITTYRYRDNITARNVLVKTVRKDPKAYQVKISGTDAAYSFRAVLNPEDAEDWACIYLKGSLLVVVRTRQPIAFNAREIAGAIARKVK
jgi:hypothetical protein